MNDRGYLYDAAGEAQADRQREIEQITEQVMADVDQLMEAIGDDAGDILRELIGALISAPSHKEGGIEASNVLLRRARHYAEGQIS